MAWLERHLQQYKGTVIAVTHDRYFLDNVAGWILELDRGHGIPYKGNYSSWLEQKRTRLQQEEKGESQRQKTLQRELDWIRMSPRARQAKGKARVNAYERLLTQEYEKEREELEIYIPPGPRLGGVVIEAEDVCKGYNKNLLVDHMTFSIPAGAIVGIVGPNGAGKTTLFRMITGQEQPDEGTIRIGETVQLGYVDQSRDVLDFRQEYLGDDLERRGHHQVGQSRDELTRLRGALQLLRRGPAEEGGHALGRRAQPGAPGAGIARGGQRAAAGRADQRPGREHDAGN